MTENNLEKIFGPYDSHLRVYISHKEGCYLKRAIYEEQESVSEVQSTVNLDNEKMTGKQLLMYYFFLYTPQNKKKKVQMKTNPRELKVLREEVLCDSATSFEIVEEDGKYYVHARISNKK